VPEIIKVDELVGSRFAAALELLREGGGFSYEGVVFQFDAPGEMRCIVESSWGLPQVSRSAAGDDLDFAASVLERVQVASPEFYALTQGANYRFELIYDYGGGAILLASRQGDQLTMSPDKNDDAG
jgi:hypothetical protein